LDLVDKWIGRLFKSRSYCKELITCLDVNIVISACRLMDSFLKTESAYISLELKEKNEIYWSLLEKWWCYSLIWSFGATVNEEGRKMIDYHIRDIESMFPHSNTVFDYYINNEKNEWASWEDKINANVWKP
jgi:dynein heavy chain, axonemal